MSKTKKLTIAFLLLLTLMLVSSYCPLKSFAASSQGPTKERANSYDNAWESAWVNHARSVLAGSTGKTAGFVLEIGDSITHSAAYAKWALQGLGKTAEDTQITSWMHAASWGTTNGDTTNKNGWYLAAADTTSSRGMTSASDLSLSEILSGTSNGGPDMPASTNPTTARQIIADPTYTGNIHIDTLLSAFNDAQCAVVMLGTNDPANSNNIAYLATVIDKLEAQHIVPILSTVPPRNDATSNQAAIQFNESVRALAQTRSLPLIDFYQEIVLRRPGTSWINTLMANDGLHPSGSGGGFSDTSDPYQPGGDAATFTTGDALLNVGYLLRDWLTVQKIKEVKQYVIDGVNPLLYGDVSGDSTVTAYDAALTAQYAVKLITLTSDQQKAVEVSGDGAITAYDAALIAQRAVGLITKFPVEG